MISFNIASIPTRTKQLIKTVDSIINQVDIINLYLNNYTENPYPHEKVNVVFGDNSLGDAGKFNFLEGFEGYYFTGDDDLIYPPTYIQGTIKEIDKYGVVSYHGRTFLKYPIESYYKTPAIRNRCLDYHQFSEPVHIPGTGVMAFHTDKFNPPFSIFKKRNMSDVWIGCYAKKQGIKIMGLKHDLGYITYQRVTNTIWEEKVDDCEYETKIINECFSLE